jgi:hypothetical protein
MALFQPPSIGKSLRTVKLKGSKKTQNHGFRHMFLNLVVHVRNPCWKVNFEPYHFEIGINEFLLFALGRAFCLTGDGQLRILFADQTGIKSGNTFKITQKMPLFFVMKFNPI